MYCKSNFIIVLLFMTLTLQAQEVLTLETCYSLAEKNHPLKPKIGLLQSQNELEQDILSINKLPKFDLAGQATYQSDVVQVPISLPTQEIEPPNKEQYKATFTASQLIYNGGLIEAQQKSKKADIEAMKQEVIVQVHQLKSQINQLYFSVLLFDQTTLVLEKNIDQLQEKIKEIERLIKNGIAPENAADPLLMKLLELHQKNIELRANRGELLNKLGLLIGKSVTDATQLDLPQVYISEHQNQRPELTLFELQKKVVLSNTEILKKKNYPRISAFGTGGIGNPGLNVLDNSLQEFYLVGAKIQWNFFDWSSAKKQAQALIINKEIIDAQKDVFEWKQNIAANAMQADIEKYNTLLQSDEQLISLQRKIVETAAKQLKHDLITTADYTLEINKLLETEINQKRHEIQKLLAKANYRITLFE